jgi:histidine ammonia-lyase
MKAHAGQRHLAAQLWGLLADSRLVMEDDALGFALMAQCDATPSSCSDANKDSCGLRCTPRILGPLLDSLDSIEMTVEHELNSTSDNPVIHPETGEVFHGGYFYGQYISMAIDRLAIALTTLSNLADRRIDRMLSPHYNAGLPCFLCRDTSGIRLGLMADNSWQMSVAAESRLLCHPTSTQTLASTGGFQDHVSLSLVAARRCQQILGSAAYLVDFKMICGCPAADLRGADLLSSGSRRLWELVRLRIPYLNEDVIMTSLIEDAQALLINLPTITDRTRGESARVVA